MIEYVDSIKLDRDNVEFNYAAEFVRHKDKLVYLIGMDRENNFSKVRLGYNK